MLVMINIVNSAFVVCSHLIPKKRKNHLKDQWQQIYLITLQVQILTYMYLIFLSQDRFGGEVQYTL